MAGIILISNDSINNSTEEAAGIIAEDIAQVVSDAILGAVNTRRNMKESTYEFSLDVPRTIAGKDYYIEITDETVFVNSTDGYISEKCTTYNSEELNYGIYGKAYGSNGRINVFCNKVEDIYKFDFGTNSSNVEKSYISVDGSVSSSPWLEGWDFRMVIDLDNSCPESFKRYGIVSIDLNSFSYPIYLRPSYFDYSKAKSDGSDLRFYDEEDGSLNEPLDYYIERWNPIGTSEIWVNITGHSELSMNSTKTIHMYFGNDTAENVQVEPDEIFDFYDDSFDEFDESQSVLEKKWSNFTSDDSDDIELTDDFYLNLTNKDIVYTKKFNLEQNINSGTMPPLKNLSESNYNLSADMDGDGDNETVNATSYNYQFYNLYTVEAMMQLYPDTSEADVLVGVLMNVSRTSNFLSVFKESYVTFSNLGKEDSDGYFLKKITSETSNPTDIPYMRNSTIPAPNTWFLQRTGVAILNTNNYSVYNWIADNGSKCFDLQITQDNYTLISNMRFNCTKDKRIASTIILPDIADIDEGTEVLSNASGPPYLSGKIGIGLYSEGIDSTSYLWIDHVRVYRTLMYDINISYKGIESNLGYWDKEVQNRASDDPTNYLFYDFNCDSDSANFTVKGLPDDDIFLTVSMGSSIDQSHNTNIEIESDDKIWNMQANGEYNNYSTCYQFIPNNSHDDTLSFTFSTNEDIWLVNAITIEKGDKRIKIGEDL